MASNRIDCVLILSCITVLGLTIDICTGANLIKTSLLGYDPIIGARYYGIGNEFMGVFIGATLVFTTAMMDRFKISPMFSIIIFFIITFVMGYPRLGANVGGMITAVSTFIFASLRLFRIKIKLKHMVAIGVSIVCVVGVMGFIDMKLGGGQSHLAGAILNIANEGPNAIFRIIERKISMNVRLIGITIWSKVLISTMMILAILFYSPVGIISKLSKLYPNLSIGWSSIIFACFVTFFVNDSGVVAAATGIIFLGMSMLYLIFFMKGYCE
ncbi:hypothetical protein IZY60_14645 [Lutibacter sp. B2]|nr:hypothetical protein [Lutibacter sp. B2]